MSSIRTIDSFVWGWEGWQQEQIREASGDAGAALYRADRTLDSIEELRTLARHQQKQIEELGVLVGVLVKVLAQSGGIDEKVLHYRVEAEIDAIAEAKRAAHAAASQPRGPQVKCVRCDRMVPAAATLLTPEGTTCDSCLASGI